MGVRGLWTLLEPAGLRADARALRGRRVAVDASIWLHQFIHATTNDDAAAAPTRGFFRRIARLLHHGITPVFVFDGSVPGLKRRTTAARRSGRARASARARRAAERVLLNALTRRALEREVDVGAGGDGDGVEGACGGWGGEMARGSDAAAAADATESERETEASESEEVWDAFVPEGDDIDPEVLSALPPSVRLEVIAKIRDRRMADNREHFAEASGKMQEFSRLQLETYLKGTKLKRRIDAVMQRSDASDPSTSKRVAAQDNREFIYSGPSSLDGARAERALALPSPSPAALDAGAFGSNQLSGVRTGRARTQAALIAPQEQFLLTTLHPTLPAPQVSKSVAETPIVVNDAPSTMDLQISFSTENIKTAAKDPLFANPDDLPDDDDGDEEWEDVEEETPSPAKLLLPSAGGANADAVVDDAGDGDVIQDETTENDADGNVEEGALEGEGGATPSSALRRKNVYSVSHGFLKGRNLGGWDAEDEALQGDDAVVIEDEGDIDAAVALGARGDEAALAPLNEDDANEQLQRAIAMSVATATAELIPIPKIETERDDVKLEEEETVDGEERLKAAIAMSLKEDVVEPSPKPTASEEPAAVLAEESETDDEDDAAWIAAAREAEEAAKHARVEKMIREVEEERQMLELEYRQATKAAEQVTDEMYRDVQELLTLFGIPYIIAPQEAEAQCAYLNEQKLVDAVITDDSDVFLFGASLVYRNFFQDKKYCEVYSADRIRKDIGLDRNRFIQLALLLGSDYTEGVSGIGIVNALEIVSAFRGDVIEASKAFKEWVDLEELTMVPDHLLPNPSPSKSKNISDDGTEQSLADAFKEKHRSLKKSWDVPENFPSIEVVKAYQNPSVDRSEEPFEWGKPDVDLLRLYCVKNFAWTRDATDQVLEPMMKAWEERDAQRRIDSFFETTAAVGGRVAKYRSKRLGDAVAKLTNRKSNDEIMNELLLRRATNPLEDRVVDYGDGEFNAPASPERQPTLTMDDSDDDEAFAALDVSQYTPEAKKKPIEDAKPRRKTQKTQ